MSRIASINLLEQKMLHRKKYQKTKKRYNTTTSNLQKLLDKRDSLRNEALLSAVAKSTRSYDEIMQYLSGQAMDE